MDVLTFNVDKDRRNLTNDVQNFDIDFKNSPSWVQARQYENQMRQVQVNVQHGDGTPFDLTGANPVLEGFMPDGVHRIIDAKHGVMIDPVNGQFRFDFPAPVFAVSGSYKQIFFRLYRAGKNIATLEFSMEVLADKVISGLVPADYITPFEDLYGQLEDIVKNGKGDLDAALKEWTDKLSALFTTLNNQGTATTTMLTTLETKIKADGLFTQADMDKLIGDISKLQLTGTTLIEKVSAALDDYGINVMQYGAVADGKTDNKDAIDKAITVARSTGMNRIYFPGGNYYTSKVDTLLDGLTVVGAGAFASVIISDQDDAVFDLTTNSTIENLGFSDTSNVARPVLKVSNTAEPASYWNIRMRHLHIFGRELDTEGQAGNWTATAIKFDLNGKGLWDVTLDDISIEWVYDGVLTDTYNTGWFTSGLFNNVTVKGFSHAAFATISNNNTMRQVSQNNYNNLTAETLYTAPNAIGYIVSGTGNDYNNCRLFGDGTYSGIAVQLKYYGDNAGDPRIPSFGYASSANNAFVGGDLEGTIDDPDNLRELQHFSNLRLQIKDADGNLQQVNINDPVHVNLLGRETLGRMLDYRSQQIDTNMTLKSGSDENGKYIQITTGSKPMRWFYMLTEPDGTAGALDGHDFSIGVRFKKMTDTSDMTLGYLRLNEQDYPANLLKYAFKNPNILGNLEEYAWIYTTSDGYFTGIDTSRFDSVAYTIAANSTVRIYDAYLVSGRAIDFSRVSNVDNFNNPIVMGGYNYIKADNVMLSSDIPVANQAPKSNAYQLDVNKLNWILGYPVVLSLDVNVKNYSSANCTSRLAAAVSVDITFEDGTKTSLSAGMPNTSSTLTRYRYSAYYRLPTKRIRTATAAILTSTGFTADYYQVGRPQIESGTVCHDYIPYIDNA